MAGELLVQTMDVERFEAIRPALDEIDAGGVLSAAAMKVMAQALAAPEAAASPRPWALEPLRRMLRRPELAPRWFLSPREIDEAVERALHLCCFDGGGAWSLADPAGPNWAALEHAIMALRGRPTLEHAFFHPGGAALAHPARGETRLSLVDRSALPQLAVELAALSAETAGAAAQEVAALARLVERARERPTWTLAYTFLL